jgi:copper chaperone
MQTATIKISGMTCGGCTTKVTTALKKLGGVDDVDVSLTGGEATVQYDERLTSPHEMKTTIEGAGFGTDPVDAEPGKPKGCCG